MANDWASLKPRLSRLEVKMSDWIENKASEIGSIMQNYFYTDIIEDALREAETKGFARGMERAALKAATLMYTVPDDIERTKNDILESLASPGEVSQDG